MKCQSHFIFHTWSHRKMHEHNVTGTKNYTIERNRIQEPIMLSWLYLTSFFNHISVFPRHTTLKKKFRYFRNVTSSQDFPSSKQLPITLYYVVPGCFLHSTNITVWYFIALFQVYLLIHYFSPRKLNFIRVGPSFCMFFTLMSDTQSLSRNIW